MKVAIIGGAGKMGRWFTRYFVQQRHDVTISDIDEVNARRFARSLGIRLSHNNSEAAGSADLIAVCTPITAVPKVIKEILDDLNPSAAVMEISSVKSPVMPIMKKIALVGRRVLSVHPLFGPGVEDPSGERIALVPIYDAASEIDFAKQLFPNLEIILVDLERHDHAMALTLSLTHFINIVLASMLAKENVEELKNLGGTTFTMQLLLSESIMTENPKLCASIQMSNPYTIQYLEKFLSEAYRLMQHVREGEEKEFSKFFNEAYSALSEHERLADSYEAMYRALKTIRNSSGDAANP